VVAEAESSVLAVFHSFHSFDILSAILFHFPTIVLHLSYTPL
jgi:hypothetical protein